VEEVWSTVYNAGRKPRAPSPCKGLHPPYDIKLAFVQKITFLLRKSTKTAATRAALFDSNMRQIVCRLALRPSSTGAPPYLSAVFRGLTFKGRGRGSRGRRREGRGLDGRLEGRLAIKRKSCCNRLYFWNSFSKIVCSLIIKYVL